MSWLTGAFDSFLTSKLKPNQSLRIKIDDASIKQTDSTKYLGITFYSNLEKSY